MAAIAWAAAGPNGFRERIQGNILAAILQDRLRLKLRVELSETYSPTADFAWSDEFVPTAAYVKCLISVAPERASRVALIAREVAETLAREGATADELERARQPMIQSSQSDRRDNGWWVAILENAQLFPAQAEGVVQAVHDYETITLEEINALARRVLVREQMCQLFVKPK